MSGAEGVPTVVGGYEVVGRVGSGSTATVFKARDSGLGRDVALKRVPGASVANLRAEAARLAQLDDPHVVSVFGFVEEPGAAYLVLEWVEGATLAEVLAAGGRLSVSQALGVTRGALLGLAHAHERGIVHGDVSASNVLVDTTGDSRLIDFGVGGSTPAYRAPEAGSGAVLTPASDVYAAAAVLVHLLTGQMVPDAVPRLGHVDAGIRPVLATALASASADRYPDAAAFLAALEEVAERTYGAAWWTTAGVPALVAPAIAVMVPLGGGAAGLGVGGAVVTGLAGAGGRKGAPWKVIVGAGAAALVIVAGAVTAIAVAGGEDSDDAVAKEKGSSSSDGPSEDPVDPVVDTVPSGEYTVRGVITKTDLPEAGKVGTVTSQIWTITPDCATASSCGGTILSSSGAEFTFSWDGTTLLRSLAENPVVSESGCYDSNGEYAGLTTNQEMTRPDPLPLTASGSTDPDTGLPTSLTGSFTAVGRGLSYERIDGQPAGPEDCPYGNGKNSYRVVSDVTVTQGADPEVVAAEEKRIAEEKAAEEKASEEATP